MEPFSAAFLKTLGAEFARGTIGRLRQQVAGTPAQKALEHCLQVGLIALVSQATAAEPEAEVELASLFDKFFHDPDVWTETARLVQDKPFDHERLLESFTEAGYDPETLPGLDFDRALDAFAAAYVNAVEWQPELQGVVQTARSRQLLSGQRELLAQMEQLVTAVREQTDVIVRAGALRVSGAPEPIYRWSIKGDIVAGDKVGGDKVAGSKFDMQGATVHIVNQYLNAPGAPEDESLKPYLETVARRSGRLPLGPLNPGGHDTAQLALLKVFITLDAGEKIVHENGILRRYTSAVAHAHENNRLIILGDPGSGKSTLFRFLSFCFAGHRLNAESRLSANLSWNEARIPVPPGEDPAAYTAKLAERWREREMERLIGATRRGRSEEEPESVAMQWSNAALVPIQIELRNFAQSDFDPQSPVTLWQYVCEQLERDDLGETIPALKKAAQRGEAIFLFDGVDEVPPNKRRDIWRAIASQAEGPYGGCRWIAACRVLSFVPAEAPAAVPVQTLSPLTEEQIDTFVIKWYEALAEAGESFPSRSADHLRAATRRPRLRTVARNPMLLTIMALVQTYYGTLPDERARLYQQCVETLLLRWQRHKEDSERKVPGLLVELGTNQQELERLLWEIAWQAHSQGFDPESAASEDEESAADIPESQVMEIACRALGSWSRAEQFVEYTERRAHLLLGRGGVGGRLFTFPHRTFQEYLAACRLASDRRPGEQALELARQGDYWREVLNLAVGTLVFNQNNREKALDAVAYLLPASLPADEDVAGWRCVWLAGEMTDVVGREAAERDATGSAFLPRLRDYLAALVDKGQLTPIQRAAAGLALGRLGDPREDVDCDIPTTVRIEAGPFIMGSKKGKGQDEDPLAYEGEAPRHEVTLPAYKIGKYPVTVAQYRRFVDAGGYDPKKHKDYWQGGGLKWLEESGRTAPAYWDDPTWAVENHPVIGVTWYEAVAYCAWLTAVGKEMTPRRGPFRLPDEAMWEKAARWTDGRRWPWGNEWDATKLNAESTIGRTSAVGIFPAGKSPCDVYDCAGNVWEWCSGPGYNEDEAKYPLPSRSYEEDLKLAVGTRALRGGSWYSYDQLTRAAFRYSIIPVTWNNIVGFRVAELLSDPDS